MIDQCRTLRKTPRDRQPNWLSRPIPVKTVNNCTAMIGSSSVTYTQKIILETRHHPANVHAHYDIYFVTRTHCTARNELRQVAADQINQLVRLFACRLLSSTPTIAVNYYYSVHRLIFITFKHTTEGRNCMSRLRYCIEGVQHDKYSTATVGRDHDFCDLTHTKNHYDLHTTEPILAVIGNII